MKLRTVLQQIQPPPGLRAGQLIISGVTGQPRMTVAFLVVAKPFHSDLPAALRIYAGPTRTAVKMIGNTTIILFSEPDTDDARFSVIGMAEWLVRGGYTKSGEYDECLTREYGELLNHSRRWPSILKKMARG